MIVGQIANLFSLPGSLLELASDRLQHVMHLPVDKVFRRGESCRVAATDSPSKQVV